VWGFAAAAIVQDGLNAIERRAAEIQAAAARGTVANPDWLALCRRRVAEVTGCAPNGQGASSTSTATTRRAGAQPPSTFHRPRASHQETASPAPDASSGGLAFARARADIASPCRAGC
jgi:hypothetical protein